MKFDNYDEFKNYLDTIYKDAPIVLTNGCFDILHAGHIKVLKKCRGEAYSLNGVGNFPGAIVVVAVDSDQSVRKLKGNDRPINSWEHRSLIINSIKSVDFVVKMTTDGFEDLIRALKPRVYVKGSEYENSLNPSDVITLEEIGCKIKFCKMIDELSSTESIEKLSHLIERM